jgi:peptidoglycan/LPS O-acetylase OafA/YrhL
MQKRNLQIEGLRAIAMLCVVLFHFCCRFQSIYMNNHGGLPYPFTLLGNFGVGIFFLISGYFFEQKKGGLQFFSSRVKKILPLYWVALIIIFIVTQLYQLPGRTASFPNFLLNFFCLGGFPHIEYVDGAHWFLKTMLVIIVFYSLVQKISEKRRFIAFVSTVLLITTIGIVGNNIGQPSLRSTIQLVNNSSGFGSSYLIVAIIGSTLSIIQRAKCKASIVMLLICFIAHKISFGLTMTIAMAIACLMFFLCINNKMHFLEFSGFQVLAKPSYAIYLIHQNIGYIIMLILINRFEYGLWMGFIAAAVMICLGIIFHKLVENKSLTSLGGR